MRHTSHQHGSLALADRKKGKVWEFRRRRLPVLASKRILPKSHCAQIAPELNIALPLALDRPAFHLVQRSQKTVLSFASVVPSCTELVINSQSPHLRNYGAPLFSWLHLTGGSIKKKVIDYLCRSAE